MDHNKFYTKITKALTTRNQQAHVLVTHQNVIELILTYRSGGFKAVSVYHFESIKHDLNDSKFKGLRERVGDKVIDILKEKLLELESEIPARVKFTGDRASRLLDNIVDGNIALS